MTSFPLVVWICKTVFGLWATTSFRPKKIYAIRMLNCVWVCRGFLLYKYLYNRIGVSKVECGSWVRYCWPCNQTADITMVISDRQASVVYSNLFYYLFRIYSYRYGSWYSIPVIKVIVVFLCVAKIEYEFGIFCYGNFIGDWDIVRYYLH